MKVLQSVSVHRKTYRMGDNGRFWGWDANIQEPRMAEGVIVKIIEGPNYGIIRVKNEYTGEAKTLYY